MSFGETIRNVIYSLVTTWWGVLILGIVALIFIAIISIAYSSTLIAMLKGQVHFGFFDINPN